MEFIPESLEALDEVAASTDSVSLRESLKKVADEAQLIAPGLVGISITLLGRDLTFTLVATDDHVAGLDALQYLDDGPCVDAIETGRGTATGDGGLLAEGRWHLMALASAAAGVRSTLTFPVRRAGVVVGSVNLYGCTEDVFVGKHRDLADALGGWAEGAIVNADLSFRTRDVARETPARLRDDALVAQAVGVMCVRADFTPSEALGLLEEAAARAGISLVELARIVLEIRED